MKNSFLATMLLIFTLGNAWALAPQTAIIQNNTSGIDIQIKYPQGFADQKIDEEVRVLIADIQKTNAPVINKDILPNTPGKNSLYVDYKIVFQSENALSLQFSISSYSRGAAHPANSVRSLNFLNGKPVTLDQLFLPGDDKYLTNISKQSKEAITSKNISDTDWIARGTSANLTNFKNWYFTKGGIAILFDTYQVAAYVYGPQIVEIPFTTVSNCLRPEVFKTVWGSQ